MLPPTVQPVGLLGGGEGWDGSHCDKPLPFHLSRQQRYEYQFDDNSANTDFV